MTLLAPAKLNLHLGIYPCVDEQGYHRADSLMVALDVADEVEVKQHGADLPLSVRCEPIMDLPQEKNTAYRAALALARAVGRDPNVEVLLRKHVPSQAGLGGASSDAASVLLALCELWGLNRRDQVVAQVARSVGADVAFFLDPVPTLLVGRGDTVAETFPHLNVPIPVVLVRPAGEGVSTPAAYRAFDEQHDEPGDPKPLCAVLRSGEATSQDVAALLANNLDPVACRLQPAVGEVCDWLRGHRYVLGAQVSGSGSCVFGICAAMEAARKVVEDARGRFGPGAWVRTATFR